MKTTNYLYGIEPAEFADLPYSEALQLKLDKAKALITELMKPHYSQRDDERINAVFDAQKFNKQLLEELE